MGALVALTIIFTVVICFDFEVAAIAFLASAAGLITFHFALDTTPTVFKYCGYFPETEICRALKENPGYLTMDQIGKMVQRVIEEDERRKDLKKIQDIEVE
ncbi:hypothetical protein [Campylobacter ureolyticus]|uniref:Uncharacterized protein n=1 Tax=Campylobacter ureolyticus TaxID=827 RepID=A0A9Q4KSH3_9BACT|nr:hypothetical protein [Campylobacter ureolyticus]MCZ6102896.1 hypothetical protein [Campylobacter ureolyticus]MCZ6161959.1 hypothetical protein [Campylobacter ureolyticus]MCZ6170965.1 hypothetical protein [Campylobacter ureolyticus]